MLNDTYIAMFIGNLALNMTSNGEMPFDVSYEDIAKLVDSNAEAWNEYFNASNGGDRWIWEVVEEFFKPLIIKTFANDR